jgi:hypothetical protein
VDRPQDPDRRHRARLVAWLPLIMGVYLLGWLGSELTLRVAVIAGDISPWLALVLFAFNFVCVLAAAIGILSLAGRELGIRELLPADEREIDDRDTSLSRLLGITLLPFLGMYAAFGQVAEAANRLVTQQWIRHGFLGDQKTVLGALYDMANQHLAWLVALLLGIYVLRRVLDFAAERTGMRILGLVVVLIESFFMLLVIVGGIRVLQTFLVWLSNRAVMQWLAEIKNALADFFAIFKIDLPEILTRTWAFIADTIWPVLVDVVARSEEVAALFEATESPDRNYQQHHDQQDRAVHQRRGNGLEARVVGAARMAAGRRAGGIDGAWIETGSVLGRLHRLSVGSSRGVSVGKSRDPKRCANAPERGRILAPRR